MYIFSLLLVNVLVIYVKCYNLDFEYAVAKSGPANSFFGFSVAEHQDNSKSITENWILVGAPKANNSLLQSKYPLSGTIFKCKPSDPASQCTEQVPFDDDVSNDDRSKANEWLGVSLKSGGKAGDVVTCAHRYEFYGGSKKFRLLEGKCFQLNKMLTRRDNKGYSACNTENLDPSKTSDHVSYGQCQSGIGLDILPGTDDVTNILIGAAGTKWWSGEVFEMDSDDGKSSGVLPENIQIDVEKENNLNYRSSYFGYAVTYGNFLNKSELHIASGGPRHKHFGKVLLYQQKSHNKFKKLIQEIPKNPVNSTEKIQIASGFGIALCSIDSDNNGLSELIVGAPFYLSVGGKERPERGIVYIYSKADNENKLVFRKTIQGEDKRGSYSNFGYAVANGGDLNLDGFPDLIVGAPREDDGAGAVYIYFGSKNGIIEKHIQRIAAGAVHSGTIDNIGLKGFGRSLGTGLDLDDNGYNDVLVGAYLSDKVALLRSRPIIKVSSRLEFSPNQLDTSDSTCNKNKVSACTQVKLCFNISEPSGKLKLKNQSIKVRYEIEADPIRGTIRKSRVQFVDTRSNKNSFIGDSTVQYKCQELGTVSLVYNDDGSIVEYPDIMFKVSYEIPYGDATIPKPTRTDSRVISLDDYPILQQQIGSESDGSYFMTTQLNFKRNCTACIPDLKLSSRQKEYTLRLGKKDFKFNITVENIGEDAAYSVGLIINLPSSLQLNDVVYQKSIACPNNVCQNVINKFIKGEKKTIRVNLATELFDPDSANNISIIVTSANVENMETTANNRVDISFDLKVVADLELFTAQSKKSLSYEGEVKGESKMKSLEEAGPFVRHTYAVQNNGPDMSPIANLTIHWPYQTRSGKHLLYLVEISDSENCHVTNLNVLNLKSNGTTKSSSARKQSISEFSSISVTSSVTGKRRTRRDASGNETIADNPATAASTKKRGIILNCSTAQCLKIKCSLKDIAAGTSRTVEIKSVLWKPSLLLDYRGEVLTIVSEGMVVIGTNASYISDPNLDNQEQQEYTVVTPITPPLRKEKILVWQIALAVVAGVILLGLMIYGLYKVGFFHRTRKHDENGADQSLINDKKPGRN